MGALQPHVNAVGGQMYQQQVHQGMPQAVSTHPAYQGQQHFSDNPHYKDSSNGGPMSCIYPNYQVDIGPLGSTVSDKEEEIMFVFVSTAGNVVSPTVCGGATVRR